jgi:signal transduction histidine kinase
LLRLGGHGGADSAGDSGVGQKTWVRCTVTDDGVGGATLGRGSGLIGLLDRIEAMDGRFTLESPASQGTTLTVELPVELPARDASLALSVA